MYCYLCGTPIPDGTPPVCPEHGPLWTLRRNDPCADLIIADEWDWKRVLLGVRTEEPYKGYWTIPGGHQNFGEHPRDAAKREAEEEIGARAHVLYLLGIYMEQISLVDWRQITVYVGGTTGVAGEGDGEMQKRAWWHVDSLPEKTTPHARACLADYWTRG